MKQSDFNHLRRLLGWVRCDIGQDPAGQQQTMIDIAGKLGIDSIDADAKARLVEGYRRAEAVPVYVRDAVKALEKALAAVGRDPGVVAPRATAETRANTGFDPGAGAGREPVLDDVQIERGLAEIGVYVWGQRGEDWLAGVEYLARLLRAGEACPAVAPLQNHPDAAAKGVACRDTPAAPPAPRRDGGGKLERQYHYRMPNCTPGRPECREGNGYPECPCWHDVGSGPLKGKEATATDWRDKPSAAQASAPVAGEAVAWLKEDGSDAWTDQKKRNAANYNGTPGARLAETYNVPLFRHAAPQASADNVRDAALEACRLVVERFGPTEQDYIFSKRMAIQKCRAVHAAAQAEQGERQWAS